MKIGFFTQLYNKKITILKCIAYLCSYLHINWSNSLEISMGSGQICKKIKINKKYKIGL